MALTTGLALGEDRLTQVLDEHADAAERKLTATHQRIETELGRRIDDLGNIVGGAAGRIAETLVDKTWL